MEYESEQLDLLIKKVASTLGSRLEGLLKQQENILDNHLNKLMIDHNGQAESITATINSISSIDSYYNLNNVVGSLSKEIIAIKNMVLDLIKKEKEEAT